jgi:hypothetical protein
VLPVKEATKPLTSDSIYQAILRTRYAIFTQWQHRPDFWYAPPEELAGYGFITDPPELISVWRRRLSTLEDLGSRLSAIESLADDAHKAKALVLLCWYPGHPDEDRRGVHHRDLFQKIRTVPLGYGYCSDQSEVFIALASIIGLPAREVQNARHCTNEFYHRGLGRWLFIDVGDARMARDEHGNYLSFLDLRNIFFRGDKATLYEFGRGADPLDEQACRVGLWYYEQDAWSRVALVLGNNVFANDRAQRRLRYLPKVVRHVICHACGVCPGYAMYTGHAKGLRGVISGFQAMVRLLASSHSQDDDPCRLPH